MKVSIKNISPTARLNSTVPTAKSGSSALLTAGTDTVVTAGTPIGLLLALTYANNFTVCTGATFKGFSPTARIRSE